MQAAGIFPADQAQTSSPRIRASRVPPPLSQLVAIPLAPYAGHHVDHRGVSSQATEPISLPALIGLPTKEIVGTRSTE